MNPWNPPSASRPTRRGFSQPLEAARDPEEGERNGNEEADAAGEQAMGPFPPENALELVNGHALVDLLILRDLLILLELLLPFGLVSGGMTPWIGFHSVMERPEPVMRVAPPTMTSANSTSSTR
jgi:hypothetical protein